MVEALATEHVPGPWLVGASEYVQRVEIYRERSNGIIDPIGCAYGSSGENIANARLIAAAPTLLGALQDLANCCGHDDDKALHAALRNASAAIAKATGEHS